ncbi:MAG: hypothetical protein E7340_03950 [Clostridiales bacterium]|nr:hypothetical protein [Clostridiales bacterium]
MGLWTLTHFYTIIPTFIVFIALAFLLGWLLKDKDEKIKYIPLQIITIILLALEFMKQGYNLHDDNYNLYALPFHYCSLFLYLFPLHTFYRGKHKEKVEALTLACSASVFFFMLIMPTVVYSDGNIIDYFKSFDDFHTVTFHSLVCLYFFLMIALKFYKYNIKKDFIVMAIFLAAYVIIALIMTFALDTNFQNLKHCNLAIVEEIRLNMVASIGFAGHMIYVLILSILTILFAFGSYIATKGITTVIEKATKKRFKA